MRRALCVGVDEYGADSLRGCVDDAERMCSVLARNQDGSPNFDCRSFVAPQGTGGIVTRSELRDSLDQLLCDYADIALFHFSGHGTVNNLDGYLVTQDAQRYDEGVPMSEVIKLVNDSPVREVVVTLDCCFSGSFGNVPAVDNTKVLLREGVSVLTASRGDQPSVETDGGGLFTSLVIDALEGGAADLLGAVTAPSIYSHVEAALGAWDQRPLFKAHVSRVLPLRRCTPPVETALLRKLPTLFPLPAEDYCLSPEHEPSSDNPDPTKTAVFRELQALNRVHLVVPIGCDHMYEAAIGSHGCRLTRAGRYYWRLARDGRI